MQESTARRAASLARYIPVALPVLAAIWMLTWEVGATTLPLADSPWPAYGQNERRNGRSPFVGPQQLPRLKWTFNRYTDHWGTDYRGTGIGLNNTVYLAAGMAGVYAIDSDSGAKKWLFSPEQTGHETWVEFPPTVASDGTLYVTSENDFIYALDPDGNILWWYRSDHLHTPVSISPDGSAVHFTSEDGSISALNRSDGTLKWRYRLGPSRVYGTGRRIPVVYDASGNLYFNWIATVWSLTPEGQKRWSLDLSPRGPYAVGPAVSDDGTLYFTYGDTIYSVSMNGDLNWSYPVGSAFDRTPTVGADGTVYIGAENGYVYALNPNGTLNWKKQYVAMIGWGAGIKSNVLLDAAGTLYFVGRDGYVYAVDSQSGATLWRHYGSYGSSSYPGIQLSLDSDGTLYAPINERLAIALAPAATNGSTTPTRTPTIAASTSTPTATSTSVSGATATATPTLTATSVPLSPTATSTATATSATTPIGDTLLINGSFENDADGNGIPDNWTVPPWVTSVSRSSAASHEGSYSLRHQSTTGASYNVNQDVPVQGGRTYYFSGWVYVPSVTGSTKFELQLQPFGSNNGPVSGVTALGRPFTAATGGWVQVTGQATMPFNAVYVRLLMKVSYLRATVYVDEFSLVNPDGTSPTPTSTTITTSTNTPTPTSTTDPLASPTATATATASPTATATATASPTATATATPSPTPLPAPIGGNLLSNEGFELDDDGDNDPDDWIISNGGVNVVSRSGNQHYEGSYSLLASSIKGDSLIISQDLRANPGEVYNFSGWINVTRTNGWFRASVELLTLNQHGGSAGVTGTTPISSATGGWVPITTSITIPNTAVALQVRIRLEYLRADLYADSFSLTRTK